MGGDKDKGADALLAAIGDCVRCGRCMSVCPVYGLTGHEGSVARGKLALLKAELGGKEDLERRMKDLLSHCLLCGACAEACASGVKADEIIMAGRELANRGRGLAGLQGMLARDVLGRGTVAKGLWKGRRLFLKDVPGDSGLHFRFPLNRLPGGRHLPKPADRTFLDMVRNWQPKAGSGPRVALFAGCVSNYLRPQTALRAMDLLESAGAEVHVPPGQACCGKPAAGAGDMETAAALAEKNIAALEPDKYDRVVAFCATCSEQLKHYEPKLAGKVVDLSQLLAEDLGWKPETVEPVGPPLRVFYHDPCHLRRKQNIFAPPRDLVASLPGVTLVGANEAPVCCGYGGIFNLWQYQLSQKLFERRLATIDPYQPDLVVTSCSGCWLQFTDGLHQTGRPYPILPLADLLAQRGLAPK